MAATDKFFDHTIILAGGAGNRLWPFSTATRPKYLLRVERDTSLLHAALLRAAAVSSRSIIIVSHHSHAAGIIAEIGAARDITPPITLLLEPQAQNTAPAVALAVSHIIAAHGGGTAICMPADHIIAPLSLFAADAARALVLARQHHLTLFGIKPHAINTGYGYLEAGDEFAETEGGARAVVKFHEKPDHATAERYMQAENFFWNSGLYAFDAAHIWREFRAFEPQIATALDPAAADALFSFEHRAPLTIQCLTAALRAAYARLPSISIDYALGERSERVAMAMARFRWNDVGSWDEVSHLIERGEIDNPTPPPFLLTHNAHGNTVISDSSIALCGVNDIIVVEEDGVVMICKKGMSQEVKGLALEYAARTRADNGAQQEGGA